MELPRIPADVHHRLQEAAGKDLLAWVDGPPQEMRELAFELIKKALATQGTTPGRLEMEAMADAALKRVARGQMGWDFRALVDLADSVEAWRRIPQQELEKCAPGPVRDRALVALQKLSGAISIQNREQVRSAEVELARGLAEILRENSGLGAHGELRDLFCDLACRHAPKLAGELGERPEALANYLGFRGMALHRSGPQLGRPGFIHPDRPEGSHLLSALKAGSGLLDSSNPLLHPAARREMKRCMSLLSEIGDQELDRTFGERWSPADCRKMAAAWEHAAERWDFGEVFRRNVLSAAAFIHQCNGNPEVKDSQRWVEERLEELGDSAASLGNLSAAADALTSALRQTSSHPDERLTPDGLSGWRLYGTGKNAFLLDEWGTLELIESALGLPPGDFQRKRYDLGEISQVVERSLASGRHIRQGERPPVRDLSASVTAELSPLLESLQALGDWWEPQGSDAQSTRRIHLRGTFSPGDSARPHSVTAYLEDDGWFYPLFPFHRTSEGWDWSVYGNNLTQSLFNRMESRF